MIDTESFLTSAEGREFLRNRVRQFALICFSLGMSFFVFRVGLTLTMKVGSLLAPSMISHLIGTVAFAGIWIAVTAGPCSVRYIQIVEAIGLIVSCIAYDSMGRQMPVIGASWLAVVLAQTYTFVARSMFVPCPGRVTFFLTASAGAPLIYLAYGSYVDGAVLIQQVAAAFPEAMGEVLPGSASALAIGNAATIAMWWAVTVTLCTFTSHVIYGLRSEAFNAKRLGQYTLEEEIGAGGMGQVYRARHALLRRPCAIKVLTPSKAGETSIARFEREVQLTAQLTHPNTVTVFDYGRTPEGLFYYAMELLDGADLQTIVEATGRLEPERVGYLLKQIAGALSEAHQLGLIHRDIKPSNIIISERGGLADVAKIVDFGLVKQIETGEPNVTQASVVTGTPLYMSPEMITAPDKLDGRSDLYSLGAVGYYLATGKHVFDGATPVEVCSHHLHTRPIPPSERIGRALPEPLETLLERCLEKDPAKRPQTAREVEAMLEAWTGLRAWTPERARNWWKEQDRLRLANRHGLTIPTEKSRVLPRAWAAESAKPSRIRVDSPEVLPH